MKKPQVELLAPASGLEAVRAAIYAGADAVYTGGSKFGARAYANNLQEDELLQAIDFVHLNNRHLYLTVNTLLKEKELTESLSEYLMPYYKQGLDAVIVQDAGVFKVVREQFPDLPIHVSTQAVVTGKNSAKAWEALGAERIVTARELSLEEIKEIRNYTSLEIESFVHGALCYCYSGQCLFSSFVGGRSGNRGRCAQPCRLPYDLLDTDGICINKNAEKYLLSPKDMCTLDILPDIIEAGVYSLKIEGRMKRPEYTSGVTEIYRKYIDLYLTCREEANRNQQELSVVLKENYRVSQKDKQRLMDLYNRGNFHSGYYTVHNGKEMMTVHRPNHNGVFVGTLSRGKKGFNMQAQTDLKCQDVLELRGIQDKKYADFKGRGKKYSASQEEQSRNLEVVADRDVKKGERYVLPDKYTYLLEKKQSVEVYRTKNEQLLQELRKKYMEETKQIPIMGELLVEEGNTSVLMISCGEHQTAVLGDVVETAQNQPIQEDYVRKQLEKTGNSPFVFEKLDITIKGNCFISVKALNQLRRDGLEALKQQMLDLYRRKENIVQNSLVEAVSTYTKEKPKVPKICVFIENLKHLQILLQFRQIDTVYVSVHAFSLFTHDSKYSETLVETGLGELRNVKEQCRNAGSKLYIVFPHIWRKDMEEQFNNYMPEVLGIVDGIVAKNMEVLTYVKSFDNKVSILIDYTAYAMNMQSVAVWKQLGATGYTIPVELNKGEIIGLTKDCQLPKELIIYGHMPMMVSAQCPIKNTVGCQRKKMLTRLKDRKGNLHYVKNYCDVCYSVIYNSDALYLLDVFDEIKKLSIDSVRLQFSVESDSEVMQIMNQLMAVMGEDTASKQSKASKENNKTYTKGHWKRGVE